MKRLKNRLLKNKKISAAAKYLASVIALVLVAVIIGLLGGVIGASFSKAIEAVTEVREKNSFVVFLLPFGGLISVLLYKITKTERIGTDRILESARGEGKTPFLIMPVVFAASVITHLFGGSAGKEGAALQIGGAIAQPFSRLVHADEKTGSLFTVCGMSALFSAVFGIPIGACVFAAEVAAVGMLNGLSLMPSFVSSITAYFVSVSLGVAPERFELHSVPELSAVSLLKTAAAAAVIAVVSAVFCFMLHGGEKLFEKIIKNPYIRIFAGGCIIVVLTLIFGTDYNGGGMSVIEQIFDRGIINTEAFLLKIIFTVVTVASGYKGGEIVPSFFIGGALGAVVSPYIGLPSQFGAAVGMVSFFSGVTNCPLAAAVISAELFGVQGLVLFAAAAFISRVASGNISLYHKQKIKESL